MNCAILKCNGILTSIYYLSSTRNHAYTFDSLNRLKSTVISTQTPINIDYLYWVSDRNSEGELTYRTTQLNTEVIGNTAYRYIYDKLGNITTVQEGTRGGTTETPAIANNKNMVTYTYDSLNQLKRENNLYLNQTIVYNYDKGGNITSKVIYPYTTVSNLSTVTPTKTIAYKYGDSGWKDLLTSYNGQTINYDTIGNPLTYKGSTLTWTGGRELKSLKNANNSISYTYDANGIRATKTVNGVKSTYEYVGNQLVYEKRGNMDIYYFYDSYGNLSAIRYANGSVDNIYYAVCNSRGDVEAFYNGDGVLRARYIYDSWGNVIKIVDANGKEITDKNNVGFINPIRYRGYYYDTETGFYYLKSRYYDPEVGRFINADGYVSTGQGILGYNMFAYCGNNPVKRADPTGHSFFEFFSIALSEIGKAISSMAPAYAACGGAAVADGPLPFGDAVGIVGAALITVGSAGYGSYQAIKSLSTSTSKAEEKEKEIAGPTLPKTQAYFTVNPYNFQPKGLVRKCYDGTKNGAFISWMDPLTNIEVFRWDENPNYSNGPHYHIHGTGHYYPGTIVPEPYATTYFPPI